MKNAFTNLLTGTVSRAFRDVTIVLDKEDDCGCADELSRAQVEALQRKIDATAGAGRTFKAAGPAGW